MTLTDPGEYLNQIDIKRFHRMVGNDSTLALEPVFEEPKVLSPSPPSPSASSLPPKVNGSLPIIKGKVQRFGENVDTDSISPADTLMAASTAKTIEEVGTYCFVHDRPEFRQLAKEGYTVVVAGSGFGCGSSRETGKALPYHP